VRPCPGRGSWTERQVRCKDCLNITGNSVQTLVIMLAASDRALQKPTQKLRHNVNTGTTT